MIETIDAMQFQEKVLFSSWPVLVEFKSEWSGSCHIVNPSLNELADEFSREMRFVAVDYDQCENLIEKYRVHKLPTVLFFCNGEIIDHVIGPNPKELIRSKIVDIILKSECKNRR